MYFWASSTKMRAKFAAALLLPKCYCGLSAHRTRVLAAPRSLPSTALFICAWWCFYLF
jgi:hypothetical protein